MSRIEKALEAAGETNALRIGKGMLNQVPGLFKEQFPGKRAIIIADKTTYEVAGMTVYNELKAAGIEQEEPFIFMDPDLHAEYSYIDQLTAVLKTSDAIPVAVGSGTINDLAKLASHLTGRRYMCVATAAATAGGFTGLFGYASTLVSGWGLGYLVSHLGWNYAFGVLIGIGITGTVTFLLAWSAKADGYGVNKTI